jgi:hypothetical protein
MNAENNNNPAKIRKASGTITMVKLALLVMDMAYQARAEMDEGTIQEYAELCAEPGFHYDTPLVVYKIEGKLNVVEGFHRVAGALRANVTELLAEIREGTKLDAMRCAIGANVGLRRSNADKKRAIEMAFREFSAYSDREIARIFGGQIN